MYNDIRLNKLVYCSVQPGGYIIRVFNYIIGNIMYGYGIIVSKDDKFESLYYDIASQSKNSALECHDMTL